MPDVRELLTASLAFHLNAKLSRIQHQSAAALRHLIQARNLRQDANSLDPDYLDPAWHDEEMQFYRGIHQKLTSFYARKIL